MLKTNSMDGIHQHMSHGHCWHELKLRTSRYNGASRAAATVSIIQCRWWHFVPSPLHASLVLLFDGAKESIYMLCSWWRKIRNIQIEMCSRPLVGGEAFATHEGGNATIALEAFR
jgi:hypothetical protein